MPTLEPVGDEDEYDDEYVRAQMAASAAIGSIAPTRPRPAQPDDDASARAAVKREALERSVSRKMAKSLEGPLGDWEDLDATLSDVLKADPPYTAGESGAGAPVCDELGSRIRWPWEGGRYSAEEEQCPIPHFDLPCDDLIERAMRASMADGNMGESATGVKAFKTFCAKLGISPRRPLESGVPLSHKLAEERLCMQFVASLVEDRGVQPQTAANYFGQVQGWHAKEMGIKLCGGLKLARLPAMLKGIKKIVQWVPPKVRRGLAAPALRKAMDTCLDPHKPRDANIRAALATAFQGLLRSAEFCHDGKGAPKLEKLPTRADVKALDTRKVVVMMRPCKNMRHLAGKTVPIVIAAGGKYIDAVAELLNLRRVDPYGWAKGDATAPLFRDPSTNSPLLTSGLRDEIRRIMTAIGENANEFGTHSLRIGGATALFAAGASPEVIRTMGRWSSDCYRLYVRACYQSSLDWTQKAGSTPVTDMHSEFDEVDSY